MCPERIRREGRFHQDQLRRQRPWDRPRGAGTHIRPILYDQGGRARYRAGPEYRVRNPGVDGWRNLGGKSIAYGIGTHANSVIAFDVPSGFTRFKARGGLDNGGTDQGTCGGQSSVQFHVYSQQPPRIVALAARGGGGNQSRDAADAVKQLDVHEGLEATLFASEPMIKSVSNIDIDHRGRVWVCEIMNYRGNRNRRPEGDRILILEDTDGDGKADTSKVFYQGRDIDSPHGICVLATADFKGTRVIVSAGDKVQVFTDEDGDDIPDKKEVLFSGISGTQHDHGIHAFVFGPDGKLYFNFGNNGNQIKDANGNKIIDMAGNEVRADRKPYQQGMVFRCNLDGSEFETLGWNFRNNWMVTVDSFGTIWQSDNDDDGNRGVRINYVMEFGNYGYRDEMTGAGWKSARTGMASDTPTRHWYQNDPGVVPNLLQTGAGSPTGITVYEGDLLPKIFQGQVIHCDAGPNVCRAYPVKKDGAGYSAEIANVLYGARDKWYRPSDVSVAPDGSLLIADWYDPGVGGHRAGDLDSGRIFRIAPPKLGYKMPALDVSTPQGAVKALLNPNYAIRYVAWTALHKMGAKAEAELLKVFDGSDNARHRARALWLLGKTPGRGEHFVRTAINDKDEDIRIVGLRLARQLKFDTIPIVEKLVMDSSPLVRRECAIALRHSESPKAAELWAALAAAHDGKDRWYLEALGIAADQQWDRFLSAWLASGGKCDSPGGRDIIWRSRAQQTPQLLAKIISEQADKPEALPRYFRAFDFQTGSSKDGALVELAFSTNGDSPSAKLISTEAIKRLKGFNLSNQAAALNKVLDGLKGSGQFVALVDKFSVKTRYAELLALAQNTPDGQTGVDAIRVLLSKNQKDLIASGIASKDVRKAAATARVLGNSADGRAVGLLMHNEEVGDELDVFNDDLMRLIFTCCHPSLNLEAQIALTLRTVVDMSLTQVARAFLVSEKTMEQRLVRAKRKIKQAGIPYAVPGSRDLPRRLQGV
ncbi:MAG: NPCBM/NEW2 domain-containing protein, partial [Planctomycetes bacterium]|nr:NPCBM/NEW2 domain-containing protein [Planctomycetota bacterium]